MVKLTTQVRERVLCTKKICVDVVVDVLEDLVPTILFDGFNLIPFSPINCRSTKESSIGVPFSKPIDSGFKFQDLMTPLMSYFFFTF